MEQEPSRAREREYDSSVDTVREGSEEGEETDTEQEESCGAEEGCGGSSDCASAEHPWALLIDLE
jgi:hypothetical protein